MVMSSHQISAMAMQQQAMFGNQANYAAQITPPGGMFGGYGGGPLPGPPPPPGAQAGYGAVPPTGGMMSMMSAIPYQMPGQYVQQGFAEQMAGGLIGAGSGMMSGISGAAQAVTGAAGMATLGFGVGGMLTGAGFGGGMAALGSLPFGGAVLAAGGIPAMLGAGVLAGGAYAGNEMYQGFRERQDVSRVMRQRFGGMMGVGGGRGGMGFSSQEMGQMSSMMRGMAADDMFTSFDELTRTLDKTSQMGLYRGVQSAAEFREKFKTTVNTLKEIAKTMHTSLDEAAGFMEQQRNQGFFSGQDINRSLMRTRMSAGATGMSVDQMNQIGQMGTQMGRSMGMLGRTGSDAMKEMASNVAMGMQMGFISDQDIAEATGGLTGAEGAQAYAARMMQTNRRWLKRGPGRVMLAGLWDQEGGIDEAMMNKALSGDISIGQLRAAGRRNIAQTGGRRSEFFLNEDRLGGQLMASGGGDLMLGVVGEHFARKKGIELEDPIMQRWLQRYSGRSQSEVELAIKQFRKMPEILQERKARFAQQLEMEGRSRAREVSGFQGFRRRMNQAWDQNVSAPLRQVGDDITGDIDKAIDDIVGQMEGRVSLHMSKRAREAQVELRSTGKGGLLQARGKTGADIMSAARSKYGGDISTGGGFLGGVGRALGMRGESLDDRLRAVGADSAWTHSGASEMEKLGYLERDADRFARAQESLNLTDTQRSELESSILSTVTQGGRAGKDVGLTEAGFFSGQVSGADNFQAIQTRIDYLEQHDPVFKRMSAGKSRHEKIALLQEGSRKLRGSDYELDDYGGPSSRVRSLAGDLKALEEADKAAVREAGKFFQAKATEYGISNYSYESMGGDPKYRQKVLKNSIDVGGLYTIAEGNEKLARSLEVLSNPEASESSRADAVETLTRVGAGASEDALGINVSDQAKRTAAAVARAAEEDPEGTQEALAGKLEVAEARAWRITTEVRQKQAQKLKDYMGQRGTKKRLEDNVEKGVLEEFRKLVSARTTLGEKGGVSGPELEKMEHDFLAKHAHTEAGSDLLASLGDDPSAVYQTGAIRRVRDYVRTAERSEGGSVLSGGGSERRRINAALKGSLGVAGGIEALGSKREQRRWMRKIQKGEVGAKEIMEQLRKTSGGQLELAEGVTTKQLESHLEGLVTDIKSGGTFDTKEFLQRGVDAAQRQEQREREGGGAKSMEDLPTLAQKQVDHLANMVKLTKTIALNSRNQELVDAINKLDIKGGGKGKKGETGG